MYIDAISIYGWEKSQFLPYDEIKFITKAGLEEIIIKSDNSDFGYSVECDLKYP